MFKIFCPHCEEFREEEEFHPKGQAHVARPADPDSCSDKEWGEYLYFRTNPMGRHLEMWVHVAGCRKFFNVVRNTRTHTIETSYKIGGAPQ